MVAFRLMVQTTVHDYLVYKDVWTPAISKESICCQDQQSLTDKIGTTITDRHAVPVHRKGEDVL